MSPYVLTLKSMRHRMGSVLLTVVSLALGIALLLGVERMRHEAQEGFTNTISGTDIIVGARSGSVSLLLSSVFHIGHVTDNVSWETYEKIERNPQVAWTIPLSLGDSHKGYAVLGTRNVYFEHYKFGQKQSLEFADGRPFAGIYDAVIGAEVASKLGYRVGQEIIVAHGSGAFSFVEHSEDPFTVVGVLKPTGTPVDQTVHVMLEGIEAIHVDFHDGGQVPTTEKANDSAVGSLDAFEAAMNEVEEEIDYTPTSITAFLVGMHSRADSVMLQRAINEHPAEALTGVLPGVALAELWQVVDVIEGVLFVISLLVLGISLSCMFNALMMGIKERRREMAILRSVGARPKHIVMLVLGEAVVVTAGAIGLGLVLLYVLLFFVRGMVQEEFGILLGMGAPSSSEWVMLGIVFTAGIVTALFPAWRCYRSSLADGLSIKL